MGVARGGDSGRKEASSVEADGGKGRLRRSLRVEDIGSAVFGII